MNTDIMDLIEQSLDATLRALLTERGRKSKHAPQSGYAYWTADECSPDSEKLGLLIDIMTAPVRISLMQQIHGIGQMLFNELKSTEKMCEVAEWVAALDVDNYEFRIDALDQAFVGVGEGNDVWSH